MTTTRDRLESIIALAGTLAMQDDAVLERVAADLREIEQALDIALDFATEDETTSHDC